MTEFKNRYEIKDNYVIGYTARHSNEFYFDLEDFEKVNKYYWVTDSEKNVICKDEQPQLSMHKLIMGNGIYIHKNKNRSDNRKENLVSVRSYHNDGKTYLNGYIAVYMPEHERAFDNGCVYEHVLVAEKMLGRKLKPLECVHHEDRDRTNNNPNNLMVFKTNDDHVAYHGGAEYLQDEDGTYYCIKRLGKYIYYYSNRTRKDIDTGVIDTGSIHVKHISQIDICPVCKVNDKYIRSKMCLECARKEQAKNIPPKEELESLIYELPFTEIGKRYGVSDNSVRKWCKKYDLPYRKKDMKTPQTN